ncbi:MAG: CheR family methyltransferase [Chthoniobacteraceae bacterium]|jgi:chemotaxis protein methyltransferase WspC
MDSVVTELCKRIGLDAGSVGLNAIERAIHHRIAACHAAGMDEYRHILIESPAEFAALIDAVVVPETWFFRDPGAFGAVASQAKASKRTAQLKYLCVPCATGEEPFSLAMSLLGAGIPADRFHIDAYDISERLLASAERGIYRRNSFRGNIAHFRSRYFQETAEGCAIHPEVRKQATFRQANLLDDSTLQGVEMYDAIFCRNLLIYFEPEAQLKALAKVSRLLRDGGLLCVAPAETGLLLRNGFVPAEMPQAFAFRNKNWTPAAPIRPRPQLRLPAPQSARPQPQPQPRAIPAPETKAQAPKSTPPAEVTPLTEALRLANEGRFEEVSAICRTHIEKHGASADAYYLLALVCDASAHYEEAAILYRKTLYLDPRHQDALAHFSLLSDKLGETAAAGALRQRALRLESTAA